MGAGGAMRRFGRFARKASVAAVVIGVGTAFAAPRWTDTTTGAPPAGPTIGSIAAQLGVKVVGRHDEEFSLGVQFTGVLEDSPKLATFGVKGFHVGARVTAARIAADRVHIEADELDPPRKQWVRVVIDANGRLVPPAAATRP